MKTTLNALLIEDSGDDAKLVLRELRQGGFDVAHQLVQTGSDMRAALQSRQWDVIICDYALPNFRGTTALEVAREMAQDTPFIFVSGSMGEDLAVQAMKSGAHDYVMKDKLARLVPAIQREMREAALREQARRADVELRASEARFRAFVDHATDAFFLHDANATILDVNQNACDSTGYTREEMIGMRPQDLDPIVDQAALDRIKARLEAGETVAFESRHRRKDGTTFPVEVRARAFWQGGRRFSVALARDVTVHKEMEDLLVAREKQFRTLAENLPDNVVRYDRNGRRIYMNPQLQRFLGEDANRLLGQTPGKSEQGAVYGEYRAALARVLEKGGMEEVELVFSGVPDGPRYHSVRLVAEKNAEGEVVGAVAIGRDITERKLAETALRQSREHLSSLINSVEGIVWEADAATFKFTFVSPQAERILGYPRSRWLDDPAFWADHIHPADRDRVMAEFKRLARESCDHQLEYRFLAAGGRTLWLRDNVTVYREKDQAPKFRGIMADMTTQKLAEQRIRQLNRTHAVLSNVNQLIVRERSPQAILDGVCRIAVDTGGFPLAWVGMADPAQDGRLKVLAHAGADQETLKALGEICATESQSPWITQLLNSGGHIVCNMSEQGPAARSGCQNGLPAFFRAVASFALTVAGQPRGFFSLCATEPEFFDADELALLSELAADVSFSLESCENQRKQQQAEAKLRASEERFRELARTIDEVFWITNPGMDQLFYVSPAYERVWGRSCQSVYDDPGSWAASIHEEDRKIVAQAAQACRVSGEFDAEYRLVRPDGQVRWIRDHGIPVRNAAGAVERIVGVARDVTEQRVLGEQLRQSQKMEAIGQLAGGVAHDFNNILTGILMQTDLISMADQLSAETIEGLREIRADTERAANLTRQLLMFSRKQVMQARQLNLNDEVTGLTKMLQRIIGEDVRLQLNLNPGPLMVHADSGMLDQVLMNLAVNARDAMPDGGRLTIETSEEFLDASSAQFHPDAAPGHYGCVTVSDTGCGIPKELLPRIFEPFFTTKEPGKGTGLGLATVFGIVKQHQGWVQVISEVGSGSSFKVCLPLTVVEPPLESAASGFEARGGREVILLCEDEASVRKTIRMILGRHGYTILEAANGQEAITVWMENRAEISLLLTDLVMPGGMNGQQLASHLKKGNPDLKIIYISGYSGRIGGREISLQNSDHFIQKPFRTNQLLEAVRKVLDN